MKFGQVVRLREVYGAEEVLRRDKGEGDYKGQRARQEIHRAHVKARRQDIGDFRQIRFRRRHIRAA